MTALIKLSIALWVACYILFFIEIFRDKALLPGDKNHLSAIISHNDTKSKYTLIVVASAVPMMIHQLLQEPLRKLNQKKSLSALIFLYISLVACIHIPGHKSHPDYTGLFGKFHLLTGICVFIAMLYFMGIHCLSNPSGGFVEILFFNQLVFAYNLITKNPPRSPIFYDEILSIYNFILFYIYVYLL